MKAEIVSVGTEILLGEIVDTNASYLAAQLPALGIDLYWVSQVGDNITRISEVLSRAWQRSDIILITGGLGPTDDDVTREAIAAMLGEDLRIDPALEKEVREFFARRNMAMPVSNLKQATLIPSAEAIHNIRGTAPGWWVERDGHILVAMPGPPGELQNIWQTEILPRIRRLCPESIIVSRTLKTFGVPEAKAGEMVTRWLNEANPTMGIYAKPDGVQLRLTAKASNRKQAQDMIAHEEVSVRTVMGDCIWGADDDTLEGVAGILLLRKALSLATMESVTGGLLAAILSDAPGASAYYKGGLVACSDESRIACGVDPEVLSSHGASSPETALAMAKAARKELSASIGLGLTGSYPEETGNKSYGMVYIAITDGKNIRSAEGTLPGDRSRMKRLSTSRALFELIKMLSAGD